MSIEEKYPKRVNYYTLEEEILVKNVWVVLKHIGELVDENSVFI